MRARGANGMGRFSVEFEVANNDDLALARRGMLPPDQVRRETIQGVVDSGARCWCCRKPWSSGWACSWVIRSRFVRRRSQVSAP